MCFQGLCNVEISLSGDFFDTVCAKMYFFCFAKGELMNIFALVEMFSVLVMFICRVWIKCKTKSNSLYEKKSILSIYVCPCTSRVPISELHKHDLRCIAILIFGHKPNWTNNDFCPDGAGWKGKGSSKLFQFTWMSVPNFILSIQWMSRHFTKDTKMSTW